MKGNKTFIAALRPKLHRVGGEYITIRAPGFVFGEGEGEDSDGSCVPSYISLSDGIVICEA